MDAKVGAIGHVVRRQQRWINPLPRQTRSLFRAVAGAVFVSVVAHPTAAQCPDGTPPPCAAARATAGHPAKADRVGTTSDPNRLAVLYFDDRSENSSLRWLADAITEALIDRLASVKQLTVISRSGVAPFRDKTIPVDTIQRRLKVGTLVTGTLQQSGSRLRLTFALSDALTGEQFAQRTIDRPRGEIFEMQDELAGAVELALRKALGSRIERTVRPRGAHSAQSWEALQRAKHTIDGADSLRRAGALKLAVEWLERADSEMTAVQSLDRTWSAPVIARGWIPIQKTLYVGWTDPSKIARWLQQSSALADSAMRLSPRNADALELRATAGYFHYMYGLAPDSQARRKLRDRAEIDFRAAVKANPLQVTAWNGLSHLLTSDDRTEEAKLAALSAYDADPYFKDLDKTLLRLFQASEQLAQRDEADKWCTVGRMRLPNNFRFHECQLIVQGMAGSRSNPDSIWKAYADVLHFSLPGRQQLDSSLAGMHAALALVRAGLPDSGRRVAVRSRSSGTIDPTGDAIIIELTVRRALGDSAEAAQLKAQFQERLAQQAALTKKP